MLAVAAMFFAMLRECSERPLFGPHRVFQVLVQRSERPSSGSDPDRLQKTVGESNDVFQGVGCGALQLIPLGARCHSMASHIGEWLYGRLVSGAKPGKPAWYVWRALEPS